MINLILIHLIKSNISLQAQKNGFGTEKSECYNEIINKSKTCKYYKKGILIWYLSFQKKKKNLII